MTKNELAINNWVRHREQGEKPYRITSITIDGDKYLYTAEGLTAGDTFVDVRAATFEPIALNEIILKSSQLPLFLAVSFLMERWAQTLYLWDYPKI